MTKCPRCNLEQKESPQCAYCGFVFEAYRDPTQTTTVVHHPKRSMLIVVILAVAGALLAAFLLISYQDNPREKSASAGHLKDIAPGSRENDLRTTVKELSGDVGILDSLTGSHTQGSILAMVIFSIIGLGYFSYGKKSQQFIMLICGIALMGYSYFVNGTAYIILIGTGLSVLPFIIGRK
jgi:hypothetical protein